MIHRVVKVKLKSDDKFIFTFEYTMINRLLRVKMSNEI